MAFANSPCPGLTSFVTLAVWTHLEPLRPDARRRRLAQAMAGLLRSPDVLSAEQMTPWEGEKYRTVLLWSDARLDVSLLALVWKSGQKTPIHDHHATCIVGVYQGEERETRYERVAAGDDAVVSIAQTTMRAGMVSVVAPGTGEIHRVEAIAPAPDVTISLHFYEVDVTSQPRGSSIKNCYREVEPAAATASSGFSGQVLSMAASCSR